MSSRWSISIDTGGTFTDCLARDPSGRLHRAKVLSCSALRGVVRRQIGHSRFEIEERWQAPDAFVVGFEFQLLGRPHTPGKVAAWDNKSSTLDLQSPLGVDVDSGVPFELRTEEEAPILAARLVTRTPVSAPLPELDMRLATTRGTNALLERRGVPTALFMTRGFGDLLVIRNQQRPDLFALNIRRPAPLYEAVVEVRGRLDAEGNEVEPLDLESVGAIAERMRCDGIRAAAIALMHSYRNPEHELRLAGLLHSIGFDHVSTSAEIAPLIRIVPRAETAVVDAFLGPVVQSYLHRVEQSLGDGSALHAMTSAGGVVRAEDYRASDSLLSGPAGGVAGAAEAGRASGFERVLGFDMGGTSTDVARYDGDFEYQFEHTVGGAHLVAPALAIETVAAGGGSICGFEHGRLSVGPHSAGADPGPACYGAGGPLTLTDVNLLLGRLDPEQFEIPINLSVAQARLNDLREQIGDQTGESPSAEALLEGFLAIANERMADAIAQVSIRRGFDPREYAMVAFGGAGGQHACGIARRLGVETVIMPADASLLSAVGLGRAAIERFAHRQVLRLLEDVHPELGRWIDDLAAQATSAVEAEGVPPDEIVVRRRMVSVRLLGQDASLPIDLAHAADNPLRQFEQQYRAVYGHAPEGKPVEVESIRVVVSSTVGAPEVARSHGGRHAAGHGRSVRAWFDGTWSDVPAFDRGALTSGATLNGPAMIFEPTSAYVIETGWTCTVDDAGAIVAQRGPGRSAGADAQSLEVIQAELFTNRFKSIASEMGQMLERTALSTNVKERLDFSCTLLDAAGELVVNAPHMPVHLGAMGLCVRAVREVIEMKAGDVIITNHPAYGGSHLPDITVITPVYLDSDEQLIGYVASRAHHAEIGGTRPGSMPPAATTLSEEGVVIEPQYLIRRGESRFGRIETLLRSGEHPSRAIEDNLADLRAAVAANHRGAGALRDLADRYGSDVVHRQMQRLKSRAEDLAREALSRMEDGLYEATEHLDDGSPIAVRIEISDDQATIDFQGTAPQHPGNLNATPAIVRSAVIYVLRLLIGETLPLNEGLMRAVDVCIPPGLLNPEFPDDPALAPAVVGGNVETSQRLVDTLLKALRLGACSQGTMNNTLFGNERVSYYETVCGGAGAGPGFDGADAVQTHMTNTRTTDPEILEHRYPVRLERFAIRKGSGGAGAHRGGDGAVREMTFLEPMSLSVLSQHRVEAPYGLSGGEPGATGAHRVMRANGEEITLKSVDGCEVGPGDRLILETPGGGGYGAA